MPQLPVGQTFKQFEFPVYEDGKLKSTLYASEAKGITLNRAETTDLKIEIYDNGAVTTTVTSPKADLYVNEQKMRTKNTVLIERADMEATSQNYSRISDLKTKKYILRTNVRVLLKHFDLSIAPPNGAAPPPASPHAPASASASASAAPASAHPAGEATSPARFARAGVSTPIPIPPRYPPPAPITNENSPPLLSRRCAAHGVGALCRPKRRTIPTCSSAPPPAGSTVITSDELHSDQNTHISVFTGNVVVVGNQFRMTCQEMTVYFTKDNKVDRIVSTGDVVITQPDRVTHCGHADYFHDDDKFVLTDSPVILDHKNKVSGPRITIFRTNQKMIVDGGRSTTVISNDNMGAPKATSTATDTPPPSTTNK